MPTDPMRTLLAALLIALPGAALAQGAPRSIADCERIKADLAYNQCLAEFGPKFGERAPRGGPVAEDGGDEPRRTVRSSRRGRSAYQRGRRGRQAASFNIVSRGKAKQVRTYKRRRR